MFILYDLIFLFLAIVYLPYSLFKRKINAGIFQRMGFLSFKKPHSNPIWIHAVSVGEVMAIKTFVAKLNGEFSQSRIFISTVTTTGNRLARRLFGNKAEIIYLPFDLSFIVRRVIRRIKPILFIAVETELWPNLLSCLKQNNVPIVIVNGRLSERSFRGYYRMRLLFKPILNKVHLFCVRSDEDRMRFIRLGVDSGSIKVTGNMKFDLEISADQRDIGLEPDERLFVCGSTHPQEEKILLGIYRNLHRQFPDLRLLLAPRHIERCGEIENLIRETGFEALRVSQITSRKPEREVFPRNRVFLLDTIGELVSFYRMAEVVFIGGSLIDRGGHNIIEPAFFAKPITFGKYMSNFKDIAETFLKNKAAIQVADKEELERVLKDILSREDLRQSLGENARAVVERNRGAVERTIEEIKKSTSGLWRRHF